MRKTPGRDRRLTDGQLRACIRKGHTVKQIAADHGMSRSNVHRRLKELKLSTAAAMLYPEESKRFVHRQINAMDELIRSLQRVDKLMDACDEWLRDAEDPERYNIGARGEEIKVQYIDTSDPQQKPKKDTLASLLLGVGESVAVQGFETKTSDPRELILKTAQEVRSTVATATDLMNTLTNVRTMDQLRDTILEEISKESPEVARRITKALGSGCILEVSAGGA